MKKVKNGKEKLREEREIESKEGATRHTLRWIFQKRNYKAD